LTRLWTTVQATAPSPGDVQCFGLSGGAIRRALEGLEVGQ
jgi:hypothetical protein